MEMIKLYDYQIFHITIIQYNILPVDTKNVFIFGFKVTENESKLKSDLIECDREKEELEIKVTVLEREKAEQSQTIRYVEDEEIVLL